MFYPNKTTTLFNAIESNDLIKMQKLLYHKIDLEQKDVYGRTPTQVAIYFGNIEIVKILLNAGAKLDFINEHSMSRAIYNRRLDILTFFIEV